jgi:prepilin-type N-terminal cleavage/methylation domain-containing protein
MLFRSQRPSTSRGSAEGFTLIEVLLVIAILAILAAVVIIAINPGKQFGEAQNAQRRSDVRSILDAIHQYSIDNYGSLPSEEIPSGTDCINEGAEICLPENSCDGISLDELIVEEKYLTNIPTDPSSATDVGTGYRIIMSGGDRITVCAPATYGELNISVTR